jgi:hypothetical protein
MNEVTTKELDARLKPYERANVWLCHTIGKDDMGGTPGLYLWGTEHDEWQSHPHPEGGIEYQFKISRFLCKDSLLACKLVADGYASIYSCKEVEREVKVRHEGAAVLYGPERNEIMLHMKRIY